MCFKVIIRTDYYYDYACLVLHGMYPTKLFSNPVDEGFLYGGIR